MRNPKNAIPGCKECHLCSLTILKSLSEQDLEYLSEYKVNMFVKKGQRIFTKGNPANGLYALYEGKVKIHQQLPSGQEQIIELLKPSDVFGYKALLCEENYSFSATAIEDSLVCLIAKDAFNTIIERSHSFKKDVIFKLADQVSLVQKKLEMNAKTARDRVLDALINLLLVYGIDQESRAINVLFNRKDLANLAGLTLETTVRTLTALKNENVVELAGKQIVVKDKSILLEEAGVY